VQLNLFCPTCWRGYSTGCAAGFNPNGCTRYKPAYQCQGGLIHEQPVTKETCYECAESCTGCMKMRVAYGFVKIEDVKHLV
jgi:hypothetical protein